MTTLSPQGLAWTADPPYSVAPFRHRTVAILSNLLGVSFDVISTADPKMELLRIAPTRDDAEEFQADRFKERLTSTFLGIGPYKRRIKVNPRSNL